MNNAGNTPLHWAALNGHLGTLRLLVPALPKSALFLQNQFGRTALSEAEANSPVDGPQNKQQECAGYLLTFMELENMKGETMKDAEDEVQPYSGSVMQHLSENGNRLEGDEEMTVGVAKMGFTPASQSRQETPER